MQTTSTIEVLSKTAAITLHTIGIATLQVFSSITTITCVTLIQYTVKLTPRLVKGTALLKNVGTLLQNEFSRTPLHCRISKHSLVFNCHRFINMKSLVYKRRLMAVSSTYSLIRQYPYYFIAGATKWLKRIPNYWWTSWHHFLNATGYHRNSIFSKYNFNNDSKKQAFNGPFRTPVLSQQIF